MDARIGPRHGLSRRPAVPWAAPHRRRLVERLGHLRPGRWSVRARLLALVVVPTAALLAMAVPQTGAAAAARADAARAQVLAAAGVAAADLVHLLDRELAEARALRDRGGTAGAALVAAAAARTDEAARRWRARQRAAAAAASGIRTALAAAESELRGAEVARSPYADADPAFRSAARALLAAAEALPAQLSEPALANRVRTVVALAALGHAAGEERDLLRGAAARGVVVAGEVAALARLDAVAAERRSAFERAATGADRARFAAWVTGPDVQSAEATRQAALAGPGTLAADADAWYVAASHTIRRLREAELETADALVADASARRAAATVRLATTAAGVSAAVLFTLVTTTLLAVRTSRRLRRLRSAALRAAGDLPDTLTTLATAPDPPAARDRALARAGEAGALLVGGPTDEINQVGSAFRAVHREALRLAADAALRRLDTEAIFAVLSRRNEGLVGRQLKILDTMEADEADPDRLAVLFRLDHLAARIRRNDENLLVLAGGEPGRRWTEPVVVADVVRAAGAEIEDYPRVEFRDIPAVAIAGHVVGDLVHLLAELMENAAGFSPPDTAVVVAGHHHADGLRLWINDEGPGMAPADLVAANARLSRPGALTASLAGTLGLLVVARLAARHRVRVELMSRPGVGTSALVTVPENALTVDHADPVCAPAAVGRIRVLYGVIGHPPPAGSATATGRRSLPQDREDPR